MPYYYDLNRSITTNGSAGTLSTHYRLLTTTNQEAARITGVFIASRFGTAGGGQIRFITNTGAAASGGTAGSGVTLPQPRNIRSPAAGLSTFNDATAITPGATPAVRLSVGFAQTGGMGGWVPIEPAAAIQMMPGATNPVNAEVSSVATSASVTADLTVEFAEGA